MEKRKKTKELSEDLRSRIVRKHEQSQGYKSISKDLNVPVSTVRSVINKSKAHGSVANLPRCGRKRKMDEKFQRKIVQMVAKEPRLTSKQVVAVLQSEGTIVSPRTIRRRLNEKELYVMAGPRPVVLSGPSGAGKSTLLKKLMKEYEGVFGFSVSHTTRSPRPGEVNGKDYHFVTRGEMQCGIDNGDFIEHAVFSGNMYGTSKVAVQAVQAQNQICILDIDMQGVKNIKKTDLNPFYISIHPPSVPILEKRLRDRNTESEESLQKRLQAAIKDLEISKEPGLFDKIIINDDLEEAYTTLKAVLKEEIATVQSSKD